MGLWHRIEPNNTTTIFETMDLVNEFIDIWLQTRKSEDIDSGELAGVIDVLYDFQKPPGEWMLIEVRPAELAQYISRYINADGKPKQMMSKKDHKLSESYVKLLKKKYEPTPIMIAGIVDEYTKEEGIILIDGRHRIYAAIKASIPIIQAYINKDGLKHLQNAKMPIVAPAAAMLSK